MVVCKILLCPYYNEGFCSKELVSINELGQCMTLFDKHGQRRAFLDTSEARSRVTIVEGEYRDDNRTEFSADCGSVDSREGNDGEESGSGVRSSETTDRVDKDVS